jgi:hypothetical protein
MLEAKLSSGNIRLPLLGRIPDYDLHEDRLCQSVLLPRQHLV